MAIYQPTNITPSTFFGTSAGVVDADDNVSISWQVNGTSALIGFSVAIYENTTESALVHQFNYSLVNNPFYGTDEKGNPRFYIYEPGSTWAANGLSNGNTYKLKITQIWKNNPGDSGEMQKQTYQNSDVIFVARAKPSVSVSPGSGTLSSVSQTFTGDYAQAQNDALEWVRWVLSDSAGNVLDDTGTIYTGVLSYTYDGFFSGQTYALKCTVQTSSGAEVSITNSYAVSYDTAEQAGGISLSCNADDSVTLSWAAGADIPGVPSASNYGTISGGVLHLAANRSIEWATVNGETMAFSSPYCFAWRGRIGENVTETETVNSGTWELWKTYPESRTTTESHTMSTSAWRINPSASTTGTRTGTITIPVTTALITQEKSQLSNRGQTLNVAIVGGEYHYKNNPPLRVETDVDIVSYRLNTAFYNNGTNFVSFGDDAYVDIQQTGNRTLEVTIYTNLDEAYDKEIYATVYVTYGTYFVGYANTQVVSGDLNPREPVITYSPPDVGAIVALSGNTLSFEGRSTIKGSYSVNYQYTYSLSPNNAYMAQWGGTLSASGGTLTSASIVSTTATGGATVSANRNTSGQYVQNAYAVTEYNANNTTATQTTIRLTYTVQVTGSESYRSIVTVTHTGAESVSIQSTTAQRATIEGRANGVYTVTMYNSSDAAKTAVVAFNTSRAMEMEDILVLSGGAREASLNVTNGDVVLSVGSVDAASVPVPAGAWYMLAVVRVGVMEVTFFRVNGGAISTDSDTFTPALPTPVSSVVLNGEQWCEYVYISQNPSFAFSGNTEPDWNSDTLFYASFAQDLQAGTVGAAEETMSVAIYRREGTTLSPIGVFDTGVKTVRDYAIRSGVEYRYDMFYVTQTIGGPVYSAGAGSSILCRQFRQHTLIEAEEDADNPGVYHPVNVWRFRDNVDAGGYTNQNQPVLLENFTKYPLWQPSSPAAKTGTLTALLGWFENGEYSHDTAAAMEKLFDLSSSINQLFYRDMKGNLYMVRLSGPISQTIDNNSPSLPVSVSVPWVETGDADGVKIYTEG